MPKKKLLTYNLVLFALVTLLFMLNFYHRTIFFRPNSVHQWRQTDCLSIAKNYFEEGMNFFQPKIHNQLTTDGRAVSECPLLNYSAAALWKVFGEHEFIYRLLGYAILLAAVFMFFNTLLLRTGSWWLSLFAASVLLTSPLLVYYGISFLADVPALSLSVICFCFLYRFSTGRSEKNYYVALLFGSLAVLVKASALVPLCLTLLTGASLFLKNNRYHLSQTLFRRKTVAACSTLFALLVVFAWYRYAIVYNNYDKTNVFLLTILPIWEMEEQQIIYNLKMLFNNFFPLFLNKPMFFLVFCLAIYVGTRFRKLEPLLKWAFIVSAVFFIFYLLFFYQVFTVHDYYLVNLFIFPVVTMFSAITLLVKSGFTIANIRFVRVFVTAAILFNGFHAAAVYRLRTVEDDKMVYWFPFIAREESELAKYLFWRYHNTTGRVEDLTPVLRAAGIQRHDKVISIPDESLNISLYLMDQKGYLISRENLVNNPTALDNLAGKVKYIVLSDTNLKTEASFRRMNDQFELYITHGPVQVFKSKEAG